MFNLRNKSCQEKFKRETEINCKLVEAAENEISADNMGKKWLKCFNSILYNCFSKMRIVDSSSKSDMNVNLVKERMKLMSDCKKKDISDELKKELLEKIGILEDEIGSEISEN